jgi:hypothetical protein
MSSLRSWAGMGLVVLVALTQPEARAGEVPQQPADAYLAVLITGPKIPAARQSPIPVQDDDCEYGYGSCQQWCPSLESECWEGTRPCFEDWGCWCKAFPEC